MSLSKHTKAELLEMLSSKGIDANSSMKKAELIDLMGPSASQPVLLTVGAFVAVAVLAWIIL